MLKYQKYVAWLGLALLMLLMSGCKSIETYYQGYKAGSENTTSLITAENQQGRWKTFDIDLNYQYDYAGNLLKISGTIDLGLYYEMNTSRIDRLDAYLFFLDDKARVIETAALLSSLPFYAEENLTFTKELKVPTATDSIAFGYYGEARRDGGGGSDPHGGGGGGGLDYFYDLPKKVKS